jgi:hypothetical protein
MEQAAEQMQLETFIAGRWKEFDGEVRATLLRLILIVVFYSVQLINYFSLAQVSDADKIFHRQVTLVSAAWLFVSLAVFISLKGGFMPAALKYVTTGIDLSLVFLLCRLGHGSASPLVSAMYVVLAMAALRFRVRLVWFATAVAVIGYMGLVASVDTGWFDADHTTPVMEQAITVCSLISSGAVLDQLIRGGREIARKCA